MLSLPARLALLALTLLTLLVPLPASATDSAGPLPRIDIAQASLQAEGAAAAETIALPYKVYRPRREMTRYRLEARFDMPPALRAERAMLQLDSWPDGGRIVINGTEVADLPTSTATEVVRHLRPFGFVLPAGLLRPEGNLLQLHWGSRETLMLLPVLRIGARAQLEPLVERQLFWELTLLQGSIVLAAVVALVMLGVWSAQRQRQVPPEYLLIGLSALGWIAFNGVLLWSPVSAHWFPWRRAIGFAGIGLFTLGMWAGLARLAGWRHRPFERLCVAWGALAPVSLLVSFWWTGRTHVPAIETAWSIGGAALGLVPLAVLLRAMWRAPKPRLAVLVAFVLVSVAIALREALIYIFKDPIGTVHLGLQLMAPLWLVTACGLLVQDFVRSLRQAESERADVDRRLRAREAELALLHAREREHAAGEERLRIMQDMHDGLGSQLVSSLALAEQGRLSPAQTAELLRGCIDDLRLAIDTLGEGPVDLALAAGNLRFRMQPRLQAAGLQVRWDMRELPDALSLPGSIALPVLRVLQEALANAVRHAQATRLRVRLALQDDQLALDVGDDGRGFDPQAEAPGKGLAGMRKRARGLGATLLLDSGAQGTQVSLRLRLPPGTPPAPGLPD